MIEPLEIQWRLSAMGQKPQEKAFLLLLLPVEVNQRKNPLGLPAAHGKAAAEHLPAEVVEVLDHGTSPPVWNKRRGFLPKELFVWCGYSYRIYTKALTNQRFAMVSNQFYL